MALWGKNETMGLIQLYRAKPCLWRVTDPDYRHHTKRKIALNDIASKMQTLRQGITAKEVQAKINGLRTQYSDQLRKQHKIRGLGGTYTKVLWCFNALQFLRHFVVPRHITGNSWQAEDQDVEGDMMTWENGVGLQDDNDMIVPVEDDISCGQRLPPTTTTEVISQRVKRRTGIHLYDSTRQATNSTSCGGIHSASSSSDDVFALFGAYVASELRALNNPRQQHLAQMDIQRVIFKRKCPLLQVGSPSSDMSNSPTPLKSEPKSPPSVSGDAVQDSFANYTLPPIMNDDAGSVAQYCMAYIPG